MKYLTFTAMFRNDRFEKEVKRVGKKKVLEELFKGGADSKINHYFDSGINPRLDKIEAFCRYFRRPVDYFVDLSDGKNDGKEIIRYANESDNYLEEAEIRLSHAYEKIDLMDKIIESKNEIISILNDEIRRLRALNKS